MKKLLFVALSFLAFGFSNFLHAARNHATYRETGKKVAAIEEGGVIYTSSGLASDNRLFSFQQTFIDLPASSTNTVKTQVSVTTTALYNGSTTFLFGALIVQPAYARGLRLLVNFASGTAVFVGTNTVGEAVRETVSFASGTNVLSTHCYLSVSSFTIYATTVSVEEVNVVFGIGVSSHVGFNNPVAYSTDVYKITEANIVRTTYTINPNHHNLEIPGANGVTDYNVWFWIKKSLLAPFADK